MAAKINVRLTDRDLIALSTHPAVWDVLRQVGREAQDTARYVVESERVAPSVWVEFVDEAAEVGHIEVRAGSLPGAPAPHSPAFYAAMLELGTASEPPRPFLYPAVEEAVRRVGGDMTSRRT